ncbi:UvrD-helicase domain-containing protein, partial [Aegicerativicinus sediminis]
MSYSSNFNIYSASAGSGKTFNIVRIYLRLLFSSKDLTKFKTILAITFTNKAVGEMKERVISTLKSFSNPAILENPNPLFELLMKDLNYTPKELHKKSAIILEHILHNYGAFDISTIDKFNHRILRTFARDMKLPTNFEVEMDTSLLLQRAVDQLIDKVGQEAELTDLLIQFAIDKADDDRSWDISFDLNEMSKILISENDLPYLKILETKTVSDFKQLKGLLTKKVESARKDINELASSVLTVLKTEGVENDFYGNYIPKHFN